MSKYAVMNGNLVANIIVTEDKEQSEKDLNVVLIESTKTNPAKIGDTYIDGVFITPEKIVEDNTNAGI